MTLEAKITLTYMSRVRRNPQSIIGINKAINESTTVLITNGHLKQVQKRRTYKNGSGFIRDKITAIQ